MFIQVNHAQSSKALSYGWTDLSAKGGLRKGSDLLKELGYDVEKKPLKVNISKEGLEAYKQMFQKNNQESSIKIVYGYQAPKEPVAYGKDGCPDKENFVDKVNYFTGKNLSQDYFFKPYVSMKDKESMLLEAYGRAYDEIVRGYENGTREMYIVDMNVEGNYRKATMEEELGYLRKSFEGEADMLERYGLKWSCDTRRAFAEDADNDVIYGTMSLGEAAKAKLFYERMKEEEKLTDIKKRLVDAANLFVSQYKQFGLRKFNVVV